MKTNTKQRILDAALALFAEKGYDGTAMREIAQKAGINQSNIYYFFDGKSALLDEIIEALKIIVADELGRLIEKPHAKAFTALMKKLAKQRDAIAILMQEAAKQSADHLSLAAFSKDVYARLNLQTHALNETDTFIAGLLMLSLTAYGDDWRKEYGIGKTAAYTAFTDMLIRTLHLEGTPET